MWIPFLLLPTALLAAPAQESPESTLPLQVPHADATRIEADIRRLVDFGTRSTLSETDSPTRGIGAARRWLRDAFQEVSEEHHDGRLQVELQFFDIPPGRRVPEGVRLANVVATLPGEDADRLIVVSGHYDSMPSSPVDGVTDAPGANDDASGTVAVLEAARLLAGWRPRATVVFLAVAGEEQGLLGSAAQARFWRKEGKEVEAMITLDIVGGAVGTSGRHEPNRLRIFSEGVPSAGEPIVGSDNDAPSRQLARYMKRAGEARLPSFEITLIQRQDRFLRGGDHRSFNQLGWAAVRMTEPHENYSHQHQDVRVEDGMQYGDLPEYVDFDYVAKVTTCLAAGLQEIGSAPAAPRDVVVRIDRLTPHSELRWTLGEESDLAGYAILVRRTHEPTWSERKEVGKVDRVTLEGYSKDDYLFAVEAIDSEGRRSLPIYPKPQRD